MLIDVSHDYNVSLPLTSAVGSTVQFLRVHTVSMPNLTSVGGSGLHLVGSVVEASFPLLSTFVGALAGLLASGPRLAVLRLPALSGSVARFVVDFPATVTNAVLEAGSPTAVGSAAYDSTAYGGVLIDAGPNVDVSWPTLTAITGQLTLGRVRSVDLRALASVGQLGVDVNSPTLAGNLSLPLLVGTSGMKVRVEVGPLCESVALPALGGGGGAQLATVSELVVVKTAASGTLRVDIGDGGGGPRAVTGDFRFVCSGGCVIDRPVAGLSALLELSGVGKVYEVNGFDVGGSGGAPFARSMASLDLKGTKVVKLQGLGGVASFVAGRAATASWTGGSLLVASNAALTAQCPLTGVTFGTVTFTNNPLLPVLCESNHGAPCSSCSGSGGGGGACSC